jgi:hypothetical protein
VGLADVEVDHFGYLVRGCWYEIVCILQCDGSEVERRLSLIESGVVALMVKVAPGRSVVVADRWYSTRPTGVKGLYNVQPRTDHDPLLLLKCKASKISHAQAFFGATKRTKRARGQLRSLGSLSDTLQLTAVDGSCVP